MHEGLFFSVTMATIWFINSFGAVLQGSLFGLVGLLPQKYSTVFMSGQGLAGTFAAIAMLLAKASDADPESAALGYFITPCVGTLVTLLSYLLLPRLEFARFYLNRSSKYEEGTTDKLLTDQPLKRSRSYDMLPPYMSECRETTDSDCFPRGGGPRKCLETTAGAQEKNFGNH